MTQDNENHWYNRYIDENPKVSEVWSFAMDSAATFEKDMDFTRQQVCEGLFNAAMDLAIRHQNDRYFQDPKDVYAFFDYVQTFLNRRVAECLKPHELEKYNKSRGMEGLNTYDAKDFGWEEKDDILKQ